MHGIQNAIIIKFTNTSLEDEGCVKMPTIGQSLTAAQRAAKKLQQSKNRIDLAADDTIVNRNL
jgi:hypothetical protein